MSHNNDMVGLFGGLFWLDEKGVFQDANVTYAKSIGLRGVDELRGRSYTDLQEKTGWTAENIALFQTQNQHVIKTQQSLLHVEDPPLHRVDGKVCYFLTSRTPCYDDQDRLIGIQGFSVDITPIAKTKETFLHAKQTAEHANRTKVNFLATMNHELRTQLNGILGLVQILESQELSMEQHEYMGIIQSYGKNILNLINDMLAFSKLEIGELKIQRSAFSLSELFSEVTRNLSHTARTKNLTLILTVGERIPDQVLGDQQRLNQIMINLIMNAIKYTDEGQIEVKIDCIKRDKAQITVKIAVHDTGIGIAKEKLHTVFNRYTQVHDFSRNQSLGEGLGLAICHELVERMGGTIGVESELGQGSIFYCELPFAIPEVTKRAQSETTPSRATITTPSLNLFANTHILLVEDNALNLKIAKLMLEAVGCLVETATSGQEALEKLQQPFDLIFMDVGLPDQSGVEITKQYRKTESPGEHTPIVALTAHVLEEDQMRYGEAGMDDILSKPLLKSQLLKILATHIKNTLPAQ